MRHEQLYRVDILEASTNVSLHISGRSEADFLADRTIRAAVLHELTVIGEAAGRLPAGLRDRHPEVPWPDIIVANVVFNLPVAWRGGDAPGPSSTRGRRLSGSPRTSGEP